DRRPKSGTIVISTEPAVRYVQPLGTIDNLFDFGITTDLRIEFFGHVRLRDARMCERLRLQPNERWLRIAGLRVLRETNAPLCWSEFYLPTRYALARQELDDLVGPIYAKV